VYEQRAKATLFSPQERVQLWRDAIKHIPNVEVMPFSGLVVELARKIGATVIVRGLRRVADFEYEFEMAFMNKNLAPEIEVVCMFSSRQYQYVSSSLLKEVALLGGDVKSMVPANVAKALRPKIAEVTKKSS
jgi:pantetheine-phosphate adenylyltransferase